MTNRQVVGLIVVTIVLGVGLKHYYNSHVIAAPVVVAQEPAKKVIEAPKPRITTADKPRIATVEKLKPQKHENQVSLIMYTASWCPNCCNFKRNVLSDLEVQRLLGGRITYIDVDRTDVPNLVGVPTIVLKVNGHTKFTTVGGMSKSELISTIKRLQK